VQQETALLPEEPPMNNDQTLVKVFLAGRGQTRRCFILAAALAAGFSLLPNLAVAQSDGLRMLVSAGSSGRTFKAIANRFTSETSIPITVEEMPLDDLRQKVVLDLATGAGRVDVVVLNNAWLGEMSRFLVDLTPEMKVDDKFDPSALVPSMVELFKEDGKQYAMPVRVGGRVLVYRTDLFEAAGVKEPPKTWMEFAEVAQKLTEPAKNQYGFIAPMRQSVNMVDTWAVFLTTFGGDFVDASGKKVAFDQAPGKAATKLFVDLYRKNKVMPPDAIEFEDDGAISAMQNGRAAMFIAYSPWLSQLNNPTRSKITGKIAVSPYLPKGGSGAGVSMTNGWGFAVNSKSKSKEAATRFVKFAASPDVQLFAAREQNNDPTVKVVFEDPQYLKANPSARDVVRALEGAKAQPSMPGWSQASEELSRNLSAAITGQKTPDEAIDESAQRANRVLSR
jgi:multiple sugar transport system substrate-binding protein